jgi:hypothetical protein
LYGGPHYLPAVNPLKNLLAFFQITIYIIQEVLDSIDEIGVSSK